MTWPPVNYPKPKKTLSWDCSLKTRKWHQLLPNLNFPALLNWVEWPVTSNNAKSLIDALLQEQKSRLSLLKTRKKIIFTKNFVKLITHENSKSIFFVNSEVLKNDLGNKHTTMLKRSEKKTHNFYICTLFKVAWEKKLKCVSGTNIFEFFGNICWSSV